MTVLGRSAALLCLCGALAACRAGPTRAEPGGERSYVHPGLGVSFLVPAGWVEDVEGDAVIFSGPKGSDGWYTTLTLQAADAPGAGGDPGRALERTYAEADADEHPVFFARVPARVAGAAAVRYLVGFEYAERPRLRAGLVVADGPTVWHLAYTAPAELFASGVGVFERALDTLALGPADGGTP